MLTEQQTEYVILVDSEDRYIGTAEKLDAHARNQLHRAFSVVIVNSKGQLLMQKRYTGKYHSGGLWTNTCCGHPRPGEDTKQAALRRLSEEMGIICSVDFAFSFVYQATLDHGLSEHEYDHVFIGFTDMLPNLNPLEAEGFKYVSLDQLTSEMQIAPYQYTIWFQKLFPTLKKHLSYVA